MEMEAIYREVAPKLLNYLIGMGSSYAQACDIVQETFLRVWKRRDELLDDMAQVSGFIFTVARNYRLDQMRKYGRETLEAEILDAGSYEADIGGDEDTAALRSRLLQAMAQLPPLLREAFVLFQVGELSVREIARQTNASEANVKVRIHRAKQRLRELLADVTFPA